MDITILAFLLFDSAAKTLYKSHPSCLKDEYFIVLKVGGGGGGGGGGAGRCSM